MLHRPHRTVASLIVGMACLGLSPAANAALPLKLSGVISGRVANSAGVPQMGASVVLYNNQDRVCERALTNQSGEFTFLGLLPDKYSVRVTLAAFVPALKRDILVQPGMRSLLAINLNTLFSSIQLAYPTDESGSVMSDEWKWVLRGGMSTRPVLRFEPVVISSNRTKPQSPGRVFSETQGVVQVSAGDTAPTATASATDIGAAFALATSVFGNNRVEVSGNLGIGSQTGVPATAFRTGYKRGAENGPEVAVTVRQLYLPGRLGGVAAGADSPMSMLRSVTASYDSAAELMDGLTMQYGFSADSVQFLDNITFFSPYARFSYDLGDGAEVSFAYTSGNARPDLGGGLSRDSGLQRNLRTLSLFPRLSLRNGKAAVQRGEELELAYSRKIGSRKYEVSAFNEAVRNAALTMVAPDGMYAFGDVLPDLFAGNLIFNAGDFQGAGFTAAVTQDLGEYVSATLMLGSMGALTVKDRDLTSNSPDELRSLIRTGRKRAATARVTGTAPGSGTRVTASYQWSDHRWVMPGHIYSTQTGRPTPGLNLSFRQPIPGISGRPCRVELTADLSNLMAQGYLPLVTASGQRVLLVETPRSFRGGLNLIF